MIIEAFMKYVVVCLGPDGKLYKWKLDVIPGKKAWKIVNQKIVIEEKFKNHLVLSIFKLVDGETQFDSAVNTNANFKGADIDITSELRDGNHFECQICKGLVIDDRCRDCHFDWND